MLLVVPWGGGGDGAGGHGVGGQGYDPALGLACSELRPPTCGINTTRVTSVTLGRGAHAAILLLERAPPIAPAAQRYVDALALERQARLVERGCPPAQPA